MIRQREDGTLEGVPEGATVRTITVKEPIYGGFHGGDPREFSQDEECATAEEQIAYQEACKAWNEGRQEEYEQANCAVSPGLIVCSSGSFGLGVSEVEMEALEVTHPDGRVEVYR